MDSRQDPRLSLGPCSTQRGAGPTSGKAIGRLGLV